MVDVVAVKDFWVDMTPDLGPCCFLVAVVDVRSVPRRSNLDVRDEEELLSCCSISCLELSMCYQGRTALLSRESTWSHIRSHVYALMSPLACFATTSQSTLLPFLRSVCRTFIKFVVSMLSVCKLS